jgi:hypothetical protein
MVDRPAPTDAGADPHILGRAVVTSHVAGVIFRTLVLVT